MFLYSLSDLEATRDELLFEVHKMSQEEEGPKPDKTVREKFILMKVCEVTVMNASHWGFNCKFFLRLSQGTSIASGLQYMTTI